MKNHIILLLSSLFMMLGCSDKGDSAAVPRTRLIAPSDIKVERIEEDKVSVSWVDKNLSETGFAIYASENGKYDASSLVAESGPGTESCLIEGVLIQGMKYNIAVQAKADVSEYDSKPVGVEYLHEIWIPESDRPALAICEVQGNGVCISVSYSLSNIPADAECGVCWSSSGTPDVDDDCQMAAPRSDAAHAFQVISNVLLDYDCTYIIRAYAKVDDVVWYSDEVNATLDEEPEEISLDWMKLSLPGIPSEIEVYETTSLLNGRKFHAWYAVADLTKGNVRFRTMVPSGAETVKDQAEAADGCMVLVNGGYFYNGRNTGISVVNGSVAGTVSSVRGSLQSGHPEYDEMYYVTRGIFGVDSDYDPEVYWAGTDGGGNVVYFDRPLPSVVGEDKYGVVNSAHLAGQTDWSPEYALSAGPVLLKDGRCPFDFSETDRGDGYYKTNFEIIPYDIFGADVSPDRTAVGCTSDGKVVLFICDGRIDESRGATLTELAAILKGIGCVDAVNFDGGGSTGMWIDGKGMVNHLDGSTWRAVVSTMGFFVD